MLLLAGCGDTKAPSGATEDGGELATSPTAAVPETLRSGGGITAIDAALDDAVAMPADSDGPTAYDRARAAAAGESRAVETAAAPANSASDSPDAGNSAVPAADAVGNGT